MKHRPFLSSVPLQMLIAGFVTAMLFMAAPAWAATSTTDSANAASKNNAGQGADLSFTAQCPEFLKEADDFAKDCLTHAREQTRTFFPALIQGGFGAGQEERHRIYFKDAKPGSHFSLGCSFNRDPKQIAFLGVYYATDSTYFKAANTAPIRYIDFQGNAGFWVNGSPINIIALRQFDTPGHALTGWRKDRIKNCENATLPDGDTDDFNDRFFVNDSKFDKDHILTVCAGHGLHGEPVDACQDHEYYSFFPSKNRQFLWREGAIYFFITSEGDLLIQKDFYQKSCTPSHKKLDVPDVAEDICDLKPQ